MIDAAAWDQRYDTPDLVWSGEPNRFLPPEVARITPGRALDLACGEGRNAVWLATLGWDVTGVDFSSVGLRKAAKLAEANEVTGRWITHDVTSWQPIDPYDLAVVFYLQLAASERRAALGVAARSLDLGGTLLVVAHDLANLTGGVGGPQDPAVLYTADDVVADLAISGVGDLEIERAERVDRPVTAADGTVATAIDCLVRASRPGPRS